MHAVPGSGTRTHTCSGDGVTGKERSLAPAPTPETPQAGPWRSVASVPCRFPSEGISLPEAVRVVNCLVRAVPWDSDFKTLSPPRSTASVCLGSSSAQVSLHYTTGRSFFH